MLPTPGFHHLHLNSADPDAAIDWYTRQFPSTERTDWNGYPALQSPNNILILFDKVDAPPTSEPQSAIWDFFTYGKKRRKEERVEWTTFMPRARLLRSE